MRNQKKTKYGTWMSAMPFILALLLSVSMFYGFSFSSQAQSQGKVTVSSAKIRKEPSTSSEAIGSATSDSVVTITGQITGSDGYTWYQVMKDAQTTGYIRSDLITITEGGTPPTVTLEGGTSNGGTGTGTGTETGTAAGTEVVAVNPVTATVSAASTSGVRVRTEPSGTSAIVKNAENGLIVTVTDYAFDSEGNKWLKVQYTLNNEEVAGFIHSDYLVVSGELVPATETPQNTEPVEEPVEEPVVQKKSYDTRVDEDGVWWLVDNTEDPAKEINIKDMFEATKTNKELYDKAVEDGEKKTKLVTLLIIVLIGLVAVIALGYIKMKEMVEEADILAAEKAGNARKSADRPQMSANAPVRQKEAKQRPQKSVQDTKPQSGTKAVKPEESRKIAAQPARPAQGNKTQPQRPTQTSKQPSKPVSNSGNQKLQPKKPRNIIDDDDDEFEFEFLNNSNWDEDK